MAFWEATEIAFSELSHASTVASGVFLANETAIHPLPVPISRMYGFSGRESDSIHSTSSSVSGRGISTSGVTKKGRL